MRCCPSGLVAQDRVEAFDIGTRLRDGLFARGSVCRAPNLLPSHTVSQGRAGHVDHRTWRALHARLKAVSRSVGELAEASRMRDVQALQVHGRFLESKFGQSDLDL